MINALFTTTDSCSIHQPASVINYSESSIAIINHVLHVTHISHHYPCITHYSLLITHMVVSQVLPLVVVQLINHIW